MIGRLLRGLAALVAYYAFFSLFPLLLVLVAAGSFFYAGDAVQRVLALIYQAIPVSRALIERNLQEVLEARGTVGLVSLLTLLWSASSAFSSARIICGGSCWTAACTTCL